ncbi:hypothetical protein [Rhizobium binxianense]
MDPDAGPSGSRRTFLKEAASFALMSAAGLPAAANAQPAPPVRPAADFVDSVGICTHFGHRDTPYATRHDEVAAALAGLGLRHVRDEALVTTADSLAAIQYRRIRELAGAGFRFSMICYDPTNPYVFTAPSLVEKIFEACGGAVDMFEGGNEPNLARNTARNPLLSAEYQRALYQAVRGDPRLQAVGVAGPSYIQGNIALAQDLSAACDFGNIHPYPGMEHPETTGPGQLQKFIAASRRVFGEKPVMVTEIGYHCAVQTTKSHLPVSEAIKARYMPRLLLWPFLQGVRRTYIYELVSSFDNGPADPESSFGLLDYRLNRTPAYEAVRNLLSICLSGGGVAGSGGVAPAQVGFSTQDANRHHLFLTRPDGGVLMPVWLGIPGWRSGPRTALPPTRRETILTVQNNSADIRAHQFRDDGKIDKIMLQREKNGYRLAVSDQLTVVELG